MSTSHQELLLTALPVGMTASRRWLQGFGCAERSIDNWLLSGRIKALYPGVYVRPETQLTWQGLVISLPRLIPAQVHVGGISAMSILGLSHYLTLAKHQTIHLYCKSYCPTWLNTVMSKVPNVHFVWHSTKRLWVDSPDESLFKEWIWREELPSIRIASTEAAILEIMEMIPVQLGFSAADELMQGVSTLSPRRCQLALQQCSSVKAKRLFFWFSDRNVHAWRSELNPLNFNLGAGKRVIQKEGRLNTKYQITVPREMEPSDAV